MLRSLPVFFASVLVVALGSGARLPLELGLLSGLGLLWCSAVCLFLSTLELLSAGAWLRYDALVSSESRSFAVWPLYFGISTSEVRSTGAQPRCSAPLASGCRSSRPQCNALSTTQFRSSWPQCGILSASESLSAGAWPRCRVSSISKSRSCVVHLRCFGAGRFQCLDSPLQGPLCGCLLVRCGLEIFWLGSSLQCLYESPPAGVCSCCVLSCVLLHFLLLLLAFSDRVLYTDFGPLCCSSALLGLFRHPGDCCCFDLLRTDFGFFCRFSALLGSYQLDLGSFRHPGNRRCFVLVLRVDSGFLSYEI